jgi:hypothetical protein
MADKPKVKLIVANATRIKAGDRLFVTIDPQFAYLAGVVEQSLNDLGADGIVLPLPKDALQFFAIEERVEITVDPKIAAIDKRFKGVL